MLKTEPSTIRMFLYIGCLLIFLIWELLAPYRPVTVSKLKRWIINLAFTDFNNIILSLLFVATITQACQYVSVNRLGILNSIEMPYWQKTLITILILDFLLYIWHLTFRLGSHSGDPFNRYRPKRNPYWNGKLSKAGKTEFLPFADYAAYSKSQIENKTLETFQSVAKAKLYDETRYANLFSSSEVGVVDIRNNLSKKA